MIRSLKTIGQKSVETAKLQEYVSDSINQAEESARSARIPKPGYKWNSLKSIIVSGSTNRPIVLKIGNRVMSTNGSLTLDLNSTGLGGMKSSLIASSVYYLYAVAKGSRLFLVSDRVDPDSGGITGLGEWSYLGAFVVNSSSEIPHFQAANGVCIFDSEIESQSHTGGTTTNAETFSFLPLTANHAWVRLELDGPNLSTGRILGVDDATNNPIMLNMQVANRAIYSNGWVPILTAQTMYLVTANAGNTVTGHLQGWKEDVEGFK